MGLIEKRSRLLVLALTWLLAMTAYPAALKPEEVLERPRADVETALPASHPMAYFLYAGRCSKEGDSKDALFWFYVGELRYGFYLAANPHLPPDGDPALFQSLREEVGSLFIGQSQVTETDSKNALKRALDWDASHDNPVTSKSLHRRAWVETREALKALKP
jgi:hypothetical protein